MDVQPPRKLRGAKPVYPELARATHVEGTVLLECRIGTDGRVAEAHVTRGHPLLDAAAIEAVRDWVYVPTLVRGVPVAVLLTVTVEFRLH